MEKLLQVKALLYKNNQILIDNKLDLSPFENWESNTKHTYPKSLIEESQTFH